MGLKNCMPQNVAWQKEGIPRVRLRSTCQPSSSIEAISYVPYEGVARNRFGPRMAELELTESLTLDDSMTTTRLCKA